jgi:leader peptidase (prepilin peptidase)/N-methyltransferase
MLAIPVLLLGWACGAFLNYLADILPISRPTAAPFCTSCGESMCWRNYFLWPRKCVFCNALRPWRTWIVEILAVIGAAWLWLSPPDHFGFVPGLALLLYFGLIVIIDIEYRMILHWVSLAGCVIGLSVGIWMHGISETFFGGVIGFVTMLVLYFAGNLILRLITRKPKDAGEGKREALGFGDVILGGIIGLMLGYKVILTGLAVAVLIGSVYSLLYLVLLVTTRRYRMLTMIPYGPFLIASALFMLYFPKVAAALTAR